MDLIFSASSATLREIFRFCFNSERMKDGITRIANGLPEEPNLC